MDKNTFLLEDKIKQIELNFIDKGWIVAYENDSTSLKDQSGIYCYLIKSSYRQKSEDSYSWDLNMGREGKPSVYGDNTYESNEHKEIEPFLFHRTFPLLESYDSHFDISEEFILYFNLYEKVEDKQNRKYYFIDEMGDLDEVIIVKPKSIKLKLKYIKEYITMRDMNFVVCFDFMRLIRQIPKSWNIECFDELIKDDNFTGTASELAEKLNIAVAPNVLSRKLRDNMTILKNEYHINFSSARKADGRIITLSRYDDNDDESTPVAISENIDISS